MLITKCGDTVTKLDFRGSKGEYIEKLTGKELFLIIAEALNAVNKTDKFTAKALTPSEWEGTVYAPILRACDDDKKEASRLLSIIVKQAIIMSPLPFRHEGGEDQWDQVVFTRI